MKINCGICETKCSKYKCPSCTLPYCTLECWNVHRSQKCEKPPTVENNLGSALDDFIFNTEDTVPVEKLKLLEQSVGVQNTLQNPHVRSILNLIDKARNPSTTLKSAMREPIFVEFVEECLKVVEPALEKSKYDL